jgi:hypothetical protein
VIGTVRPRHYSWHDGIAHPIFMPGGRGDPFVTGVPQTRQPTPKIFNKNGLQSLSGGRN